MLDWWAARILAWSQGSPPRDPKTVDASPPDHRHRDVYVYFDNDANVRAPFDAISLHQRLGNLSKHTSG
jgi:uncharacterized protein YecE (DUF72 family)